MKNRYFSNVCALILLTSAGSPFIPCGNYSGGFGFPLLWTDPETFHLTYTPGGSYEDSRLERVGEWMTVIMDKTRDIRVVPSPAGDGKSQTPRLKPDFLLKEDGRVVRLNNSLINPDLSVKRVSLPEVIISYEGREPNYEQSITLGDLASYARITRKRLSIQGRPLVAWLQPTHPYQGLGWFKPYQFDVRPGISLLPEGVLTITPIAKALQKCEIAMGRNIDVTSAIRTPERQRALYQELKGLQPVAPAGESYHDMDRGGIAIDVDNWNEAKPCLERHGFMQGEPGRGPLPNDPWHFTFWGPGS
jgi:hypothetical protein